MTTSNPLRTAEPLLPVELGSGKVRFAQGMKAGRWVFATGLMAQDFVNGIAPDVLFERAPQLVRGFLELSQTSPQRPSQLR